MSTLARSSTSIPAVASLLLFAWMRTAILAAGIAVVRSVVVFVEDGVEVLHVVLRRLGYRPDSAWSKRRLALSLTCVVLRSQGEVEIGTHPTCL